MTLENHDRRRTSAYGHARFIGNTARAWLSQRVTTATQCDAVPTRRRLVFITASGAALVMALIVPGCAETISHDLRVKGPAPERRAVQQALRFVPSSIVYPVSIIDPEAVPDSRAVRQLDAFTVLEPGGTLRPKIYINRESLVLQEALRGSELYRQILAAVIVHEATHIAGGSETAARAAELEFFSKLTARGLVSRADGLRYVELLRGRSHAK